MKTISIDIETYCGVDLKKCGVYKYAESEDFEILLFAYSVDGNKIQIIDLAQGEKIPKDVLDALSDTEVIKTAFNANFERVCLSRYLNTWLEPTNWHCTRVWSAVLGLPLSLDGVGAVLGLDKQKLSEGKNLINYFCKPCKETKVNGGRTRNMPYHSEEKWEQFKEYNIRDVEVEMKIREKLSRFPLSDELQYEFEKDQRINDLGILVDMKFVENAIAFDKVNKSELLEQMQELTGLENPNSVVQLKAWLDGQGFEIESLGKKEVASALKNAPKNIKDVLELRAQISKSSVKKYNAMQNSVGKDGRVRGMFQFYGANRTGRFSGRLVQLQNLPQNHISDLKEARALVSCGEYDAFDMLYNPVSDTLSELIRTSFVPKDGKKFIVADFSAIEARVIAWIADEKWRLEVFEKGQDIYCASASRMFKVPVEKNGVNGHLRQKGKIAELALGYGGSVGALTAMGALDMGIEEDELKPLVTSWRGANQKITALWWGIDRAVKNCVKERRQTESHGIKFECKSGFLFITLPSGRKLAYVKPKIGVNNFGSESVTYEGVGEQKKWCRIDSYGPKFVENIVQAISRDLLMFSIEQLDGFDIIAHVHDEVIIEADKDVTVKEVCDTMGITPLWAKGLLLNAEGFECEFYKKD